jgi:hypothetical protein
MFTPDQLAKFKTFSQSLKGTVADPHRHRSGAMDGKPKLKARDGVAGYRNSRGALDDNADPEMMEKVREFLHKNGMRDQGIVKVMQVLSQEMPANASEDDFEDMPAEEEEYVEDESELEARQERMQRNTEPTDLQHGRLSVETQFKNSPLQQNIGKSLEDMPSRDVRFGCRRRAMDDPPDFAYGGMPKPGGTMTPIKRVTGDEAKFNRRYPGASRVASDMPVRSARFTAKLDKAAKQERGRAFAGAFDSAADGRSALKGSADRYPNAQRIKQG